MRRSSADLCNFTPLVEGRRDVMQAMLREFLVEPPEIESVTRTVGWLGIDFFVTFDDRGVAFNFSDADAEVGDEFIEGCELGGGRPVAIEITDEANTQRDIIEVVAGDVSAVDLAGPAVANFDFSIARGVAITNDKVVGEAVLHLADVTVVDIKDAGISLPGSAVVHDDIFPAFAFHDGLVDCFSGAGREVAPAFEEAVEERPARRFVPLMFLQAGFFDQDRRIERRA